jgi:hypothetical protein
VNTRRAGFVIIAFGLFLMLCPAAVFALNIPVNFIPLFLNPITIALFAFGIVFVSLGFYFNIIGKRQV